MRSESFLALARAAGVADCEYAPGGLEGAAKPADRTRPRVVIHPGSGDNFPGRRWPTRRFGLVARALVDAFDAEVIVTGTGEEQDLAREVSEASERPLDDRSGRMDLRELIDVLAGADILISNDTGPVHIASALGVPVLGLYGPNTPLLYGPLSPGSRAFYDAPVCSPCITNFNYKTSRCLNPVCIRAIGVDEVTEAALALLAQRAERTA